MPLYYQNDKLFSEIYLEEITAQPERQEVLASLRVLREYRDYAETDTLKAWVSSYIHEVLAALGFNPVLKTDALTLLNPMGTLDQPVSLCYVTLPEEDLDNTTMGRNWAEKVIRSLREQEMQWGLLTNGKLWRIYHLDEPMPYETYFEIDLDTILTNQAQKAYQIFHKFMKAENFVVDDEKQSQFDRFKKESKDKVDYIENELQNALKQREEGGQGVLSDICMGYVEELRNAGDVNLDDEDMRQKIYHGAMLYMFRLLFLFYADARGLLSDENHDLLGQIYQIAGNEKPGPEIYSLWDKLSAIFVDIDQTYNGGLFSPQESEFTQFIEETQIKDQYLSPAFHNLTTYKEKDGKEHLISYRDMGVRHLGTLYEGLLEHKLFIAPEDTEVKVTKGKVSFIPVSKGGKLVVGQYLPSGSVYFAGDPSERKSTGSYYTPEFIVDYIVQSTVGEKLSELKSRFLKIEKANLKALSTAINEEERQALAGLLEENSLRLVREEVLNLSVLDPAMGSGHFLVNATNQISNTITELLNDLGIEGEAPTGTGYWRRWVVENCIYGVDINPLAVELAKLSLWILSMAKNQPLSFMNHHLKCGNSLVGARLDEIGSYPLSKKKKEIKQFSLFDRDPDFKEAVQEVMKKSRLIAEKQSQTLEDIAAKKEWLEDINQCLSGYKAICDVHTELFSSPIITRTEYKTMVGTKDFLFARAQEISGSYFNWELEFPEVMIKSQGFDVIVCNPPYLGEKGHTDQIREVRQGYLGKYYMRNMDLLYFFFHLAIENSKYNSYSGLITTNYFFTAKGAKKLRTQLKNQTTLRKLINFNELKLFDSAQGLHSAITIFSKGLSENIQVYGKVCKKKGKINEQLMKRIVDDIDPGTKYCRIDNKEIFENSKENYIRISSNISEQVNICGRTLGSEEIISAIKSQGTPLSKICKIDQGLITGADKVTQAHVKKGLSTPSNVGKGIFVLDEDDLQELILNDNDKEILVPFYKNSDIRRYYCSDTPDRFLIYATRDIELQDFPGIEDHLLKYQKILDNRSRSCGEFQAALKLGKYWVVFNSRRPALFQGPKIVCPQRAPVNTFAYNETDWYASADVYFITNNNPNYSLKYVLGLLNSTPYFVWFRFMGSRKGDTLEFLKKPLKEIPMITGTRDQVNEVELLVSRIIELSSNYHNMSQKTSETINQYQTEIDEIILNILQIK